jgi:hypothetical protein
MATREASTSLAVQSHSATSRLVIYQGMRSVRPFGALMAHPLGEPRADPEFMAGVTVERQSHGQYRYSLPQGRSAPPQVLSFIRRGRDWLRAYHNV